MSRFEVMASIYLQYCLDSTKLLYSHYYLQGHF